MAWWLRSLVSTEEDLGLLLGTPMVAQPSQFQGIRLLSPASRELAPLASLLCVAGIGLSFPGLRSTGDALDCRLDTAPAMVSVGLGGGRTVHTLDVQVFLKPIG